VNCKKRLLTKSTLKKIEKFAPDLKELVIKEAVLCAQEITLKDLSIFGKLKSIAFRNCEFLNKPSSMVHGSWFKQIESHLPFVDTIEISGTGFIEDHDLMVIAKKSNLKKFILTNSIRVGLAIPYLAIAFRFGFENLEEIDVRGTSMQNNDIQSVLQSKNIQKLYIGPMGTVKRQILSEENIHNMIMSDPRREENVPQQVLVINMGPNGPNCRQAEDEELDSLGLGWVLKQKQKQEEHRKKNPYPDHMFIGKDGSILKPEDPNQPSTSGVKRKADNEGLPEEKDSKRHKNESGATSTKAAEVVVCRETVKKHTIHLGCVNNFDDITPDGELSDELSVHIPHYAPNLKFLHLAGCALSNSGLRVLLKNLPLLESINVMFTRVTQDFVEEMRREHTECKISDARPPVISNPHCCNVFCHS